VRSRATCSDCGGSTAIQAHSGAGRVTATERGLTAKDALQRDVLEALVEAWPGPFDVRALEYGTVAERRAAWTC
jgi:hypothetical protein